MWCAWCGSNSSARSIAFSSCPPRPPFSAHHRLLTQRPPVPSARRSLTPHSPITTHHLSPPPTSQPPLLLERTATEGLLQVSHEASRCFYDPSDIHQAYVNIAGRVPPKAPLCVTTGGKRERISDVPIWLYPGARVAPGIYPRGGGRDRKTKGKESRGMSPSSGEGDERAVRPALRPPPPPLPAPPPNLSPPLETTRFRPRNDRGLIVLLTRVSE